MERLSLATSKPMVGCAYLECRGPMGSEGSLWCDGVVAKAGETRLGGDEELWKTPTLSSRISKLKSECGLPGNDRRIMQ